MGVVAEALEDPLVEVLVDRSRFGDLVGEAVELGSGREFAEEQQVGDLEEGGLLGELLDRVAAVAQVAGVAVEFADGAGGAGRVAEGGVVEVHAGEQVGPRSGVHGAVDDRDLDARTVPVVGECDALVHGRWPRITQGQIGILR